MSRKDARKYPLYLPHHMDGPKFVDKGLTLVYAMYNNEGKRFDLLWNTWSTYPEYVRKKLHVVIVDDCAKVPVVEFMTPSKKKRLSEINIEFYRIKQDLKWNTPGALNLGVLQAPTDWVITMDSDCVFDVEDIVKLMTEFMPDDRAVYYFNRTKRTYADKELYTRYHPCTTLMHKETFKRIGGFDEDFVGERSGGYAVWDRDFEWRVTKYDAYRVMLMNVDVHEYMPCVTGGKVASNIDHFNTNVDVMRDKHLGRRPANRQLLNFEWEKHDLR